MIVDNFSGTYSQQVRIVGATEKPASLPYRANMTLLDAMIAVGGLNQYAAGNRARLVRFDRKTGLQREYELHIDTLLKRGDAKANVQARARRRDHHPREHVLRSAPAMGSLYEEARLALHAIWQRRWLALGVAWGIALFGWAIVALVPNRYESKGAGLCRDAVAAAQPGRDQRRRAPARASIMSARR